MQVHPPSKGARAMQPANRRPKWLLASVIFSLVGATVTVLLLWTARGRTTAQAPRDPAPREEHVRFEVDGNALQGVLVLPATPGPHPAIVFVNGSGNSDS